MRRGVVGGLAGLALLAAVSASSAQAAQLFVPVVPCRIVDTRLADLGKYADPPPADFRHFYVTGDETTSAGGFEAQGGNPDGCEVPLGATAGAFNFTVTEGGGRGWLIAFAHNGTPSSISSTINFTNWGATSLLDLANQVIVPIEGGSGPHLTVVNQVEPVHLVIDVTGYFLELDVTEGTGIDVTNPSGPEPAIALESTYQLPQGCTAPNDIPKFAGGVWTCASVTGGSGSGFTKSAIYESTSGSNTATASLGALATGIATAFCHDANDIPLSGHCDHEGNLGTERLVTIDQDAIDWNSETNPAQFQCEFYNVGGPDSGVGHARLMCLTVP